MHAAVKPSETTPPLAAAAAAALRGSLDLNLAATAPADDEIMQLHDDH